MKIDDRKIHNWKIICNVAAFSFSSFQLSLLGSFPLLSSQDASLARELLSNPRRQSLHCKFHSSTQSTIVGALDPQPPSLTISKMPFSKNAMRMRMENETKYRYFMMIQLWKGMGTNWTSRSTSDNGSNHFTMRSSTVTVDLNSGAQVSIPKN